jgi:hypothetical protein
VTVPSNSELDQLNRFIKLHNPGGSLLKYDVFPCIVEAKEVFTKAGFDYTCIDVDERPGTIRIDLAKFEIPRPRGRFGLVVNVGTTEHLASPAAAFALMHEMCTEGGVIFNDVPLFGFGNHGLINTTAKFWHALIWMNSYKVLNIRTRKVNELTHDRGNFFHDYLDYIEGLRDIQQISYMINAVLKKQTVNPFIVPFDAIFPNSDSGRSLARLIYGSFYPFMKTGAYSADEVTKGINYFLKLNAREYRVSSLEELETSDFSAKKFQTSALGLIKKLLKKFVKS